MPLFQFKQQESSSSISLRPSFSKRPSRNSSTKHQRQSRGSDKTKDRLTSSFLSTGATSISSSLNDRTSSSLFSHVESDGEDGETPQSIGEKMRQHKSNSPESTCSTSSDASSLASFRQLRFSMSYRNSKNAHTYRDVSNVDEEDTVQNEIQNRQKRLESYRDSSTVRSSVSTERMTDMCMHEPKRAASESYVKAYDDGKEEDEDEIDPTSITFPTPSQRTNRMQEVCEIEEDVETDVTASRKEQSPKVDPSALSEVSIAALQTRRAFQQMVLAMEDEDSDSNDSDDEGPQSSTFNTRSYPRSGSLQAPSSNSSTLSSIGRASGGVRVSHDEYRKFQFRLRQLEEQVQEQASKQAHMEATIEREVENRTRKVVETMDKKISMYKRAKDLECEREVQRRVSEREPVRQNSGLFRGSSRATNLSFRDSALSSDVEFSRHTATGAQRHDDKHTPLDKILHPRRSKRRKEKMKEQEEQQLKEMEQFREFIRSTEMNVQTFGDSDGVADYSGLACLQDLGDADLAQALANAPTEALIEMVCTLHEHVTSQERQLEDAKNLLLDALEAKEEAQETAKEAVDLSERLDAKLFKVAEELKRQRSSERRTSVQD